VRARLVQMLDDDAHSAEESVDTRSASPGRNDPSPSQKLSAQAGVGVTGRYSNRQITQLAAQLLDWSVDQARD